MKWLKGFYLDNEAPEGAIELTDERYEELLAGQAQGLTIEERDGIPVLVDYRPSESELALIRLRSRRASECFPVINRGTPWYNRLTAGQVAELDAWYQSWRDGTETKIVPEKPQWLE